MFSLTLNRPYQDLRIICQAPHGRYLVRRGEPAPGGVTRMCGDSARRRLRRVAFEKPFHEAATR